VFFPLLGNLHTCLFLLCCLIPGLHKVIQNKIFLLFVRNAPSKNGFFGVFIERFWSIFCICGVLTPHAYLSWSYNQSMQISLPAMAQRQLIYEMLLNGGRAAGPRQVGQSPASHATPLQAPRAILGQTLIPAAAPQRVRLRPSQRGATNQASMQVAWKRCPHGNTRQAADEISSTSGSGAQSRGGGPETKSSPSRTGGVARDVGAAGLLLRAPQQGRGAQAALKVVIVITGTSSAVEAVCSRHT